MFEGYYFLISLKEVDWFWNVIQDLCALIFKLLIHMLGVIDRTWQRCTASWKIKGSQSLKKIYRKSRILVLMLLRKNRHPQDYNQDQGEPVESPNELPIAKLVWRGHHWLARHKRSTGHYLRGKWLRIFVTIFEKLVTQKCQNWRSHETLL